MVGRTHAVHYWCLAFNWLRFYYADIYESTVKIMKSALISFVFIWPPTFEKVLAIWVKVVDSYSGQDQSYQTTFSIFLSQLRPQCTFTSFRFLGRRKKTICSGTHKQQFVAKPDDLCYFYLDIQLDWLICWIVQKCKLQVADQSEKVFTHVTRVVCWP